MTGQVGSPDEIVIDSKSFKNSLQIGPLGFSRGQKVQCYYSVTNAFQLVFWVKYIIHVRRYVKVGYYVFSCHLYYYVGTTVLNDNLEKWIQCFQMYFTIIQLRM